MQRKPFKWEIKKLDDQTVVLFAGDLDERCSLEEFPTLSGELTFDLAEVARVTSGGVTRWIKLLNRLASATTLSMVRCSVPVVTQLNMVRGFMGHGVIKSFYAPYVCESSGEEEDVLLTPDQVPDTKNPPTFPSEEGQLVLNDLPRRYFAFLNYTRR
jgi:hypothetical protein